MRALMRMEWRHLYWEKVIGLDSIEQGFPALGLRQVPNYGLLGASCTAGSEWGRGRGK